MSGSCEFRDPREVLVDVRAQARRVRLRRRATAGGVSTLVLAFVLAVTVDALGDQRLEVTDAPPTADSEPVVAFDDEVELGHLPPGYVLVSDELSNFVGSASGFNLYNRIQVYAHPDGQQIVVARNQSLSLPLHQDRHPVEVAPSVRLDELDVNGHPGWLMVSDTGRVTVSWTAADHVVLSVEAQGLAADVLVEVARGLVHRAERAQCLAEGRERVDGVCAAGITRATTAPDGPDGDRPSGPR